MTDDDLVTGLRAWTKNQDAITGAAVELLIEHDHWIWDEGFTERCVSVIGNVARLDFAEMKRYHDEGPPCSTSQAAILLVAADLGSNRWQIPTLDGRNRLRVADAVARATGVRTDG